MVGSRVTVDIDDKGPSWKVSALKAYHELRRWAEEVEVRVSSSGSGIHLVAWFEERLSDEDKETIRRQCGDDWKRLELDHVRRQRGHVTNVLWSSKGSDGKSIDDDFETLDDALSHIEASNMC